MSDAEIHWARDAEDIKDAIAVRERVFIEEQGVPAEEELDGRDEEALYLLARDPGTGAAIGTLRLLLDGEVAKVGRVAVDRDRRRRGIAARMLDLALAEARTRGATRARLASQLDAVALYERAGFAVQSGVFEDAGIPHVWMCMRLATVA